MLGPVGTRGRIGRVVHRCPKQFPISVCNVLDWVGTSLLRKNVRMTINISNQKEFLRLLYCMSCR